MSRLYIFAVLFCVVSSQNLLYSQDVKIQGVITDVAGNLLEHVVVIITQENGEIIAFSQSSANGEYSIEYKTNKKTIDIKFRRIGVQTLQKQIATTLGKLDVSLELSTSNTLDEIVVKTKSRVKITKDTIAYRSKYFTDGSEKNAEDLLEKLPGISVNRSTGTIKYQGKEIKKILLDGDDLTRANYKVLSKNLSADWIEEVEIIKKFNDKRLLRGIKKSQDIAINLKLNENAKAPFFGKVNFGVGIESKYLLKTELLSYIKKMKLLMLAETNNLGTDLETYDMETYLRMRQGANEFISVANLLENTITQPLFFKPEDFTFGHGAFISNAMLLKPQEKISIGSLTSFYDNHLDFFTEDFISYFTSDGTIFSLNESQSQIQRPQELFQDLKLDYQVSKNQDLSLNIQYKNVNSRTQSVNKTSFQNILQSDITKENRLITNIAYTNKITEKIATEIEFRLMNDHLKETLEVIAPNRNSQKHMSQAFDQANFGIGAFLNFYGKFSNNLYINSYLGLSSSVSELPPLFTDSYVYKNIYSQIELKKQFKKIALTTSSKIRGIDLKLTTRQSKKTLFEPLIGISYKDSFFGSAEFSVNALFSLAYRYIHPIQLFSNSYFINYRSRISYQADFSLPQKDKLFFISTKIIENKKSHLSTYFEFGLEKNKNELIPHSTFQNDTIKTRYVQSASSKSLFTNVGVDKYISVLKTNLGIIYKGQINQSFLSLEEILGRSTIFTQEIKMNAGILLTKKINMSLSFSLNSSKNKFHNSKNEFHYQTYFLKCTFRPNQKIKLVSHTQFVNFGKNKKNGMLSNLDLAYSPKKEDMSLELSLKNIFNTKNIYRNTNTPSFFSRKRHPIRPRFLIGSIKYKF